MIGHVVIRAVAPGGSNNDALPDDAPSVISAQTRPKTDALNVPIGVLPQIVFTEPVKHVPGAVTLVDDANTPVGIALSGVGPSGPVADLSASSVVTSLTIQPLAGLKYNTRYTLRLSEAIVDTDDGTNNTPANKPLVPYETSFTTFAPEAIGRTTENFTAGGMAVIGDKAYIATPQTSGRWFTNLRLFDVSDPTQPLETVGDAQGSQLLLPPPAFWLGMPVDLVAEEASPLTGGPVVAVAANPLTYPYHTATVRLYDVADDQAWRWISAVTLGRDPMDGMIRRIELKGTTLYAATAGIGKGIQVVDLGVAQDAFNAATANGEQSAEFWQMLGALNSPGIGLAQQAIVQTIPVDTGGGDNSQLWDLAVTDLTIDQITQPAVVATGRSPLVLANPQTGELLYNGQITSEPGGDPLTSWGYGVAAGTVAGTPIAVVSATGVTASHVLAVIDLTDPRQPRALATIPLPGTGSAVHDVVLRDTNVFIGTTTGTLLVSVVEPSQPRLVGVIPSVSGRLGFSSNGILIGTQRGLTQVTDPEGGLRTAALGGPLVLVPYIRPQLTRLVAPAPNTSAPEEEELISEIPIAPRVIGADVSSGFLSILANGVEVARQGLGFVAGLAATTIARGTRKMKDAVWSVIATADTADGPIFSGARRIDAGQVALLLDHDNDRSITPADETARQAGKRWTFWSADRSASLLEQTGVVSAITSDDLEDFATIQLKRAVAIRDIRIRLTGDDFQLNGATKWSIGVKSLQGLQYLENETAHQAQLAALNRSCSRTGTLSTPCGRTGLVGGADNFFSESPDVISDHAWMLREIPAGTTDLLLRCDRCPNDASRRLVIEAWDTTIGRWVLAAGSEVTIKPIRSLMSAVSARPEDGDVPLSDLTPIPEWKPLHQSHSTNLTVVLHGFTVDEEGATDHFFPKVLKRMYWAGLPVLEPQAQSHAVVGVSWSGDSGTPNIAYFPIDEFRALQTGVPLARFLNEQKSIFNARAAAAGGTARINVVAHSLGAMVANNALAQLPGGTVDTLAMIDGTVPAEAFDRLYVTTPAEIERLELYGFAARSAGFARVGEVDDEGRPLVDRKWELQWDEIVSSRFCAPENCAPLYDLWRLKAGLTLSEEELRRRYVERWRKAPFGNSPWRGLYWSNPRKARILNFYNPQDQALEISEQDSAESLWSTSQRLQKPHVGLPFALIGADNTSTMYWAALEYTGEEQHSIWAADGPEPQRRAELTRHWAELAFWFQPLSAAVGIGRLVINDPEVEPLESFDLNHVGGNGGFPSYPSHRYMSTAPFWKAKDLYGPLAQRFR